MAQSSILLKGGQALLHEADDSVTTKTTDILIEGGTITKIEPSISPPNSSTKIIDCESKLITPGFIDTHRHLWQTQLKGRHIDQTLWEYMPRGNMASYFYTPLEVFMGSLAGALESLDAGTTTIVDHAHMAYSPEICKAGLDALEASGVRATYCITPTARVKEWSPKLVMDEEIIPAWWDDTYAKLAQQVEKGSGRVRMGLGYDTFDAGDEKTVAVVTNARTKGAKIVTSHSVHHIDPLTHLSRLSLLGPDLLISHYNNRTPPHDSLLASCGAHISSTPSTELQMTHGHPTCFHPSLSPLSSLGVDCHSATSASLVSEMRLLLQSARAVYNQTFNGRGTWAPKVNVKAVEVFNLATIKGARAVGMESEIGSLNEGKRADVVVWDKGSPGMVCAGKEDAVAAVVMHSSVRDVEVVVVDGVLKKEGGVLKGVEVAWGVGKELGSVIGRENGKEEGVWEWSDIAKVLVKQRERIQGEWKKVDYERVQREMGF